ncbi:MAG: oxidoreductase FAD/NAD(P)-binding domain protein [Geminicoccaceae bacterium]|nr:oxidoreductase FAD/NAD(P)-binding domain protein [Geminicoccaceae bacterium]
MTAGRALAQPPRIEWRAATVAAVIAETPRAKTLVLDVPGWPGHLPGQHVDVRLTAEDGYQAQRSYSIASEPTSSALAITIERLDDGEVSPYLTDALEVGDRLEIRGPIGGYFVWEPSNAGPLFLVAGGSGVVPLMAMLRARAVSSAADRTAAPATLLYSARSLDEIIYREELAALATDPTVRVEYTLTRSRPHGWTGLSRRIDAAILGELAPSPALDPYIYVCGPTGLVESVGLLLVDLGHDPMRIRTERFGPTGS